MTAHILRLMGYFSRNRQSIFIGFVVGLIVFMLLGEWAYSRFIGPAKWETSGTVGMVPTQGAALSPKVRRTVAAIDGTCFGIDPEGD